MINKRILIVAGTRPELIKLVPVYLALRETPGVQVSWVSTGQHREMLNDMYEFFSLKPDFELHLMTENQGLAELSGKLLASCTMLYSREKPDYVLVQGDTTTAMVAALSAFYLKLKVVHVEAGLRSHDKSSPFPEEGNRRMISVISDIHFAPTLRSVRELEAERVPGLIFDVGNTVIDALLLAATLVAKGVRSGKYERWNDVISRYELMVLITCHRRENFGSGIESVCLAIRKLAQIFPAYCFIFPVHLNPMVNRPANQLLSGIPNVFLSPPVPYDVMVYLMQNAYLILTDSGGIQEEAPSLSKPVLVMRDTTERPEGIECGCAKLVGVDTETIFASAHELLTNEVEYRKMIKEQSPYGDGESGKRIATILSSIP